MTSAALRVGHTRGILRQGGGTQRAVHLLIPVVFGPPRGAQRDVTMTSMVSKVLN